jgi:hypothetical protein
MTTEAELQGQVSVLANELEAPGVAVGVLRGDDGVINGVHVGGRHATKT